MSTNAPRPGWIDEVQPNHHGIAGRAFAMTAPADALAGKAPHLPDLGRWLLHVPGAHPFWTWWVLTAAPLRDLPDVPPAERHYPEAEYELLVVTLNPDHPPPDPRAPGRNFNWLTPPDVCEQFHDVPGGDDRVRELLELFAAAVANGQLSPDQDHRAAWRRSLHVTLAHVRDGHHPLGQGQVGP